MIRINIKFTDDMLHALDNIAQTEKTTRGRLLSERFMFNFCDRSLVLRNIKCTSI